MEEKFLCYTNFPIGHLHTEKYIPQMTEKEHKYAAYRTLAAWAGFPIILQQVSRESVDIYYFLDAVLKTLTDEEINDAVACNDANEKEKMNIKYFSEYAAVFFQNCGNYLGHGDVKFIPRISLPDLKDFVKNRGDALKLLEKCEKQMYDISQPNLQHLGFNPHGVTTYYEPIDFSPEEQAGIDKILTENKIHIQNTNIIREKDRYSVIQFSVEVDEKGRKIGEFNNLPVYLTKGKFSKELKQVNKYLKKSLEYVANDTQKEMIENLIESFETGNLEKHIEYSKLWVKDIDPNVETDLGFIECYRDPAGIRTEFEGFVTTIDHKESEILHKFVNSSAKVLSEMPYPKVYERDTFSPPSYNALNVLSIETTMLPVGINIPNYDEIRMHIGFKNVSLTNVMFSVPMTKESIKNLPEDVQDTYMRMFPAARKVGVAIHELYGHGSGTLFSEEDVKTKEIPDLLHPGQTVKTFYGPDMTFSKVFGSFGASYEECRAETTSLFMSYTDTVMDIFDIPKEDKHAFQLISAYSMFLTALKNINCYSPETHLWKQAHAQGRFCIFNACLKWSNGAVTIDDSTENVIIKIDPTRLKEIHESVSKLLIHLNYYKSACLAEEAGKFYEEMTSLDDKWLSIREKMVQKPEPRAVHLAAVVRNDEKGVRLETIGNGREPKLADVIRMYTQNIDAAKL